jgi:hypothetical protein
VFFLKIAKTLLPGMLLAAAAFGGVINPLDQTSTAGFDNGAGSGQTARGWDFLVNSDVVVTQLGVNAATSIPITLTLWNAVSGTELGQTVVSSSAHEWIFADLATPVALTAGNTYSVIGWADTSSGSPWYLFSNAPPAAFTPTGTIQFLNARFDNGYGPDVFPRGTLPSPAQYGITDIGYVPAELDAVPEPFSLTLTGAGALLLCGIRRRKTA